jgi:site-specific DNA recombinase
MSTRTIKQRGALRGVIYARYSPGPNQKETSIEAQVATCSDRAKQECISVDEVYADRAATGRKMAGRSALTQLLVDAKEGRIDVVLTESLDRIARSLKDMATIAARLEHAGVRIFTLADGYVDDLHIALKGWAAARFSKDLAQKVRRGQDLAVRNGRAMGTAPFGYRLFRTTEVPKGGREIVPDEAAVMRRVFEEYDKGRSTERIAKTLNTDGIRLRRGPWTAETIIRMLHNPIYIGQLVHGRVQVRFDPDTGERSTRSTDPETHALGEVPHLRIIDDELWRRVQQRLGSLAKRPLGERVRARRLLSGLIKCGCCGNGYRYRERGTVGCRGRIDFGTCNNSQRLNADVLEEFVLDLLTDQLRQPGLLEEYTAEYGEELSRRRSILRVDGKRLVTRESELTKAIDRLESKIESGEADGPAGKSIMDRLHTRAAELQEVRAKMGESSEPPPAECGDLAERLRLQLNGLRVALQGQTADAASAREAVRDLIDEIVLTPTGMPENIRQRVPINVEVKGRITSLMKLDSAARIFVLGTRSRTQQKDAEIRWRFECVLANAPRPRNRRYSNSYLLGVMEVASSTLGWFGSADIFDRLVGSAAGPGVAHARVHLRKKVGSALSALLDNGLVRSERRPPSREVRWTWIGDVAGRDALTARVMRPPARRRRGQVSSLPGAQSHLPAVP